MFFDIPTDQHPYITVGIAFGVGWLAWMVSWWAAALWASRAAKRPPLREEALYRVLTAAGALLMILQFRHPRAFSPPVFWLAPLWLAWLCFAIALCGFAFCWWARIHLGRLWSGRVTRKDDHRIVDTGPYGLVRHPIYTGLLTSLYATVLPFPGPFNVAGVVVLTVAFVIKARLEERFLMQELGAEAYAGHKRRVPMLVPFWPMRH